MNERIKELAEQVDREFDNPGARHKAIERFAELIIQECCNIADEVERADMDSYVSKYIKAHFGVEL